ncbi:MAG TPA: hypothetical protein VEY51_21575, partial [Chondromyces sp.]|nr:hypothetical protein [Chondromyces sp.]
IGWSYGGIIICGYVKFYGDQYLSNVNFVNADTLIGTNKAKAFFSPERETIHTDFISVDAETHNKALSMFVRLLFHFPPPIRDYYFIIGYNTRLSLRM